jgi:hypothetical protein
MNRLYLLIFAFAAITVACCSRPAPATAANFLDADTMKAALHTATPVEDGFIEKVVAKVNAGKLPVDLVQSTFLWARKKPLEKRFFYFKQALIARAQQRGIKL